ncbi:MAG: hypothetical protein AB2807_04875, partial [Candidatus Sedimenticola endophacoides]
AGEEAVSLLAAGHFFHWIKLCTYELNSGFEKLDTLRKRLVQRAGRLIRPKGKLTLSMSANGAVKKDLLHILEALEKTA